ncbi:ATP-binding cassette domain-containing protein [Candidatus Riflebacteria bacterium]
MIRVEKLAKSFGTLRAVRDLSFQVKQGEVFGLVGPDGAGKSTVMRLLATIMDPSSGDAWVAGQHITKQPEKVKENIAYMSQKFGLYQDLTVMENINFYCDLYGVPYKGLSEKIAQLLDFSNLTDFTGRLAGKLSGGMKQKLSLVCALVHTPKVLLLDEPTNGVDPVSRRDFWRILYRLVKAGVSIFVSTAYLDEAERCNRLILLHEGEMIACDSPVAIKKLLSDKILEVVCADTRNARKVLQEIEGFSAIQIFGDRLHISCKDIDKIMMRTESVLAANQITINSMQAIEPGLEDVFIAAIDAQKRDSNDT